MDISLSKLRDLMMDREACGAEFQGVTRSRTRLSELNNEISEREIKQSISLSTATKRIKYIQINLPKETKKCIHNIMTLMKEIKDNIDRWRYIPISFVGRINIVKLTILPNAIYRLNAIPIKVPMTFFTELEQKFHNSYGDTKDPE